ncbi:hypothetical protein [Bradyrhizobium sp. 164]|uniref:hypothetical protein n=1 Tax=Bradyrhizobium sp. 164 TaxID=2782637 RepID=UPI001FF820C9|nr:hypothetical protein [Bradyrhizobium sp. 164]MCK1595274.1 hypothetical protein [Bradyrhizobium sp. 164]
MDKSAEENTHVRRRQPFAQLGRRLIPVAAAAFDRRLMQLDEGVLTLATKLDAAALYAVWRFLLWDLDDPIGAR